MNGRTTESLETEEGLGIHLPPHLTENFEKADAEIRRCYGQSPGVPALLRLWLGCATGARVKSTFERMVLDIGTKGVRSGEERYFDDDEF